MEKLPVVTIVIVNYNTTRHLRPCLDSIQKHLAHNSVEVVVVDNNSPNRDIETFPELFPNVRFLFRKDNDGFGAGCNYGAARATADTLLFMNPDVVIVDDSLMKLVEVLKTTPDAGVVSGAMLDEKGALQYFYNDFPSIEWELYHLIGYGYNQKIQKMLKKKELLAGEMFEADWFHGAFQMMRKRDFDAVGGFNEEYFMYGEDVELCFKVKYMSVKRRNICVPEVKFIHAVHSSISNESIDSLYFFHMQRGKLLFIQNYQLISRSCVWFIGLLYLIVRMLIMPFWTKYRRGKYDKTQQLLSTMKLYLSASFLQASKYRYIKSK